MSEGKKLMLKEDEEVTQLIVCNNYREEQEKKNIPLGEFYNSILRLSSTLGFVCWE